MVGLNSNDRLNAWMNQIRLASSLQQQPMGRPGNPSPLPSPIQVPGEAPQPSFGSSGVTPSDPGTIWRDPQTGQWYSAIGPIGTPSDLSGFDQTSGAIIPPTYPAPQPGAAPTPPAGTYRRPVTPTAQNDVIPLPVADTSGIYGDGSQEDPHWSPPDGRPNGWVMPSGLDNSGFNTPTFDNLNSIPTTPGTNLPAYVDGLRPPGANMPPGFNTTPAPQVDYVPFNDFNESPNIWSPTGPGTGLAPSEIFSGYDTNSGNPLGQLLNNQYSNVGATNWDYTPFANISIGRPDPAALGNPTYTPFYDYPTDNAETVPAPLAPNNSFNDFTTDETPTAQPSEGGNSPQIPSNNDITESEFGGNAANIGWDVPAVNYYYDPNTGQTYTYDENWQYTGTLPNNATDTNNTDTSNPDADPWQSNATGDPWQYNAAADQPWQTNAGSVPPWETSAGGGLPTAEDLVNYGTGAVGSNPSDSSDAYWSSMGINPDYAPGGAYYDDPSYEPGSGAGHATPAIFNLYGEDANGQYKLPGGGTPDFLHPPMMR